MMVYGADDLTLRSKSMSEKGAETRPKRRSSHGTSHGKKRKSEKGGLSL